MTQEEITKRFKIVDMMLTMYSIARDSKMRWSRILDILLLAGSTILVVISVIDPRLLLFFGQSESLIRLVLGIFSTIIFFFSIISMLVNWKGDASRYAKACESLSALKADYRIFLSEINIHDNLSTIGFMDKVNTTMNNLPGIPEKKFHKYKQIHKRKIELSKLIDKYPGSSILFMKAILCYNHNSELFKKRKSLSNP